MKNVKRIVAFLLALICAMTTTMNPLRTKAAETKSNSGEIARTTVQFEGAGGTFSYEHMMGFGYSAIECTGTDVEAGKPVSSSVKSISDPVFFDASRKFLGWKLCILEEVSENGNTYEDWVQMPGTKLYTTNEVMEYVVSGNYEVVQFTAQWEGEDDQYYGQITFDLYGGEMTVINHVEQGDVPEDVSGWSIPLRRDGNTLKSQIDEVCDLSATPTKDGATFEGWLEFKIEDDSHVLVSDRLYTTDEILNQVVPSYDPFYVAKWSDMEIEEYYNDGSQDSDGEDSDGDTPWFDDESEIIYWFNTGGGELHLTSVNLDNGNTENEIYFEIFTFFSSGNNTIKASLDSANYSFDSIEKQNATFEGWTVIEYGSANPVYIPTGTELNVGDPDQIMVFGGTFGEKDLWMGLCDYKEYPNKMSTEEIVKLDGTKNYYFIANWKETSESVKISLGEGATDSVIKEVVRLVEAIKSGQVTSEMRELYSEELINAIADAIQAGNEIETEIVAMVVTETQVNAVTAGEIKNYLGEKGKLVQYLDLSIVVKSVSTDGTVKELGTLKGLVNEITFTMEIPENLMQGGRTFFVLRNHEGKVDKLNLIKNADGTYSFKTDRFSTYVLAYDEGENKIPQTGDNNGVMLYGALMVLALAAVCFSKKSLV